MSGKIKLVTYILILLAAIGASAQTDPALTQYFQAPTLVNPAAAGDTDFLRIRAGSRLQWLGIEGAPRDFMAAGDIPFRLFNRRFGAGVNLSQESIGLYNTLSVNAQITFIRQKLFKGMLSAGVQVGYLSQKFRGSEVFIPDGDDYHESTDEAIPTSDVNGGAIDFGAGVWYTHRLFWAGLSGTHLLAPTIRFKREGTQTSEEQNWEFPFRRQLYFMTGSNIPIKNTLFEVLPSLLVRSDLRSVQASATVRLRWKQFLTAGIGYRTQDAVSLLLEAQIKGFTLAYSYDYATSAIMRASSGSHEVWVGYSLKLDFSEKNRNRHKSIRIM